MKNFLFFILALGLLILAATSSGCIERHYKKTETIVMKIDGAENIRWSTAIDNRQDGIPASAPFLSERFIQTSDSGYGIAGIIANRSGRDLRIIRLDSNGSLIWERRVPDQNGEVLALVQRDDGGFTVSIRQGYPFGFDASGALEYNHTSLEWITSPITHQIYRNVSSGKTRSDSLLSKGNTGNISLHGGGMLSVRIIRNTSSGSGQRMRIVRTGVNTTQVWATTMGVCSSASCMSALLGMHESENHEYEIVYQSWETGNASDTLPTATMYTRLDRNGRVLQEIAITNITGLPLWITRDGWISPTDFNHHFSSLIPQYIRESFRREKQKGDAVFREESVVRTNDGGYALLGMRCYW